MEKLFELLDKHPTEALLLIVFVSLLFREEIKKLIIDVVMFRFVKRDQKKLDTPVQVQAETKKAKESASSKMAAYLYSICEDIKTVYVFKNDIVFTEYRSFFEGLTQIIEKERKSGRLLVLSLVNIRVINDFAKEVFRDAIMDAIIQNNVRMLIVFPALKRACTPMVDLYQDITRKVAEKSPKTIQIKVDDRTLERI